MAVIKPIVEKFVREHKNLPNRTIAKLIVKQHVGLFRDVEHARCSIRDVRGSHGKHNKGMAVKDLVRTKAEINSWKNRIPVGKTEGFKFHKLSTEAKKWLDLSDVHIPYHSKRELILALEFGKELGCDGVLLKGDAVDFYMISSFCHDPRMTPLNKEIKIARKIFDVINELIQPKAFVWKLGNHEDRLEKFVMSRTPELLGIEGLTIEDMFKVKEHGIEVVPATDPIQHKALTLIHGNEYKGGFIAPVNPARGMFLKATACVASAHNHKTSEHTEQTIRGEIFTCWSTGCLCELHPKYSPLNKWNHGFSILETGEGEMWKYKNYRIVKGVVV